MGYVGEYWKGLVKYGLQNQSHKTLVAFNQRLWPASSRDIKNKLLRVVVGMGSCNRGLGQVAHVALSSIFGFIVSIIHIRAEKRTRSSGGAFPWSAGSLEVESLCCGSVVCS